MDLPIAPKFFKKLELFQELKRLDKRNKSHEEWDMEKEFLLWAQNNHFHLGTYLDTQGVVGILKESGKFTNQQVSNHTLKMMQNIEEHGWADWFPRRTENSIKINNLGMLVAEVLSNSKSKPKRTLYGIFSIATWLIFWLTFLTLVLGVAHLIYNFF